MVTLNGWRQPRGGRWRLDVPELTGLPPAPPDVTVGGRLLLGALVAIAVGVVWWLTALPVFAFLPLLGMADLARLIDGIPTVASAAERDSLFPAPVPNQRVHDTTLNIIQRFGAAGWTTDFYGTNAAGTGLPGYSSTIFAGAAAFTGTIPQRLTAAIAMAVALGYLFVFVPKSMLPYDAASVPTVATWGGRMIAEGANPAEYDVEAYGATRGGVSTANIQAAIDAQKLAGYGVVRLRGAYYTVGSIRYYTDTVIKGSSPAPSGVGGDGLLQQSGATAILVPDANRMAGFLFEDFYVYGGGNAANVGGIDLTGAHDYTLTRVGVTTCGTYNIRALGGTTAGDAGFAHFYDVQNTNVKAGGDAWLLGSSANDQPDALSFVACRTNSNGATFIHYSCTGAKSGPGSHDWVGCSFEGAPTTAAILVDAAGAGPNCFQHCRFETTTTPGLTVTIAGFGTQYFAKFDACTWATNGGTLTWTDTGPILSPRINELVPPGRYLTAWSQAVQHRAVALVSGAAPALNASLGNYFTLAILTNIAVVIAVPSLPPPAGFTQDIDIAIRNASGGALTTPPTFNTGAGGFKFSAVTNPGNGTQVVYRFRWDPVQSFWYEVGTHLAAGL